MSRYSVRTKEGYEFVYGFDRPLACYFAQVWVVPEDPRKMKCLLDIEGRGRVMNAMEKYGVIDDIDPDHIEAMVMDFPF